MATFFFDNDISFRIVRALRELVPNHELLALRERFAVSEKDVHWIPEAGKNGWIVISRDANQRRRDAEHRALKENGVIALYIRQGSKPMDLYADAARIIKNWPKISEWGVSAKAGTLARLDTNNSITLL